jgi:hypothetical protein
MEPRRIKNVASTSRSACNQLKMAETLLKCSLQIKRPIRIVIVILLGSIATVTSTTHVVHLFRLWTELASCSDVTDRDSTASTSSSLLSSEELRCIWNCSGSTEIARDDPRYLNYIRSFVTKPAAGLPRRLDDKTGRKHFSQAGKQIDH